MTVPCNGCTICCRNDLVRLLPNDDPTQYKTQPHPFFKGQLALAHKPNKECIYLTETGCTIHDSKPQMCREMDCRRIAAQMSFTQARKSKMITMALYKKGRDLLKSTRYGG